MRSILWENKENHSVEYFDLFANDSKVVLQGTIIMLLERLPTRIAYKVECDKHWKTRAVAIRQERSGDANHLALEVKDGQVWQTGKSMISFATGICDVDLEVTPATNTLPIRRIGLKVGGSQLVDSLWIRFPSLKLERLQQRYTRIDDRLYKYENPLTGYEAQLEVDESGLIMHYGDLWHQAR